MFTFFAGMEFKTGDKVTDGQKEGVVVEIMPDSWIRPVKVDWGEGLTEYFTLDGKRNSLSEIVFLKLL